MGRNCATFATPWTRVAGIAPDPHSILRLLHSLLSRQPRPPRSDRARPPRTALVRLLWQPELRHVTIKILQCFGGIYMHFDNIYTLFFITFFPLFSHGEFLCFCMNLLIYSFMYYLFRAKQNDMA